MLKKKSRDNTGRIRAITAFLIFFVMYAFFSSLPANAATCTTTTGGSWVDSSIWDCGHVPLDTDNAVVTDGASVMAGAMLNSFSSLTIGGTSELIIMPDLVCHDTVEIGGDGTVTFHDCSMGTDTVHVVWGDGSQDWGNPGEGDTFSHRYAVENSVTSYYTITHYITSGLYTSTETIPVAEPLSPTGTLSVTTESPLAGVNVYAYQGNNMWHVITDSTGSATLTPLPTGQYTVYLYYPTTHNCNFTNGTAFTVMTDATTTVDATSCN